MLLASVRWLPVSTFTGNRQHGRLHEVNIGTFYKHTHANCFPTCSQTKKCTHKTQARSRTHTLCGNTALGDVLLFFFFPLRLLHTQRLQKTRTWTVRGSTRQKALEVSGSVLCYRVETDNLSSSTRPLNNPVYKRMYVCHLFKYTVIYIYFFCIFIERKRKYKINVKK